MLGNQLSNNKTSKETKICVSYKELYTQTGFAY